MNERRSVDWAAGEHGRRYGRSWAFAALAVWLAAGHASAEDPPSAEETAAARAIALEGIKLADAGRCDDAIEKLARAQKLYHSPVVLGRLGECQIARGMLVEGTENLRKVLREPLPANPPSVVLRARERAQSLLDRAKGRIGALNIVVKGPPEGVPVLVKVDGEAMNLALLGADRPTDPGEHVVEASAEGYSSASVRVALTAADRQTVIIELRPDPGARAAAASASPGEAAPAPLLRESGPAILPESNGAAPLAMETAEEPEVDRTAAYVAWGAGGAAIVAGSVLGFMALDGKSDLEAQCSGKICPESSRDRLDSARAASTAAGISFALGGLGLGLGTLFYFNAGPSEDPEKAESASDTGERPKPRGASARAWVGLGRVGVSGEF